MALSGTDSWQATHATVNEDGVLTSHKMEVQRSCKSLVFTTKPLSAEVCSASSIQFAQFIEGGRMHLNPKALDLMQTIKKPIACLTICGPYRSGKSYYLSRFLGLREAFKVSPQADPCTMGIWMSTYVLECDEFVVLLFDTEGTEAAQNDSCTGDINKFISLCTLMSSYLVYNTNGTLRSSELNGMSYFTHLSQSIVFQEKNDLGEVELKEAFPHFLCLLRDSELETVDCDGRAITPTDYLKSKILVQSGKPNPTLSDSVIRVINTCFPSVECLQIPHPHGKPHNKNAKLNPKFDIALDHSISIILAKINPRKGGNGEYVSGEMLAKLAHLYAEALNDPNIQLDIDKSWIGAVKQQLSQISDTLIKSYESEMNNILESKLPIEEGNLCQLKANAGGFIPSDIPDSEESTLYGIHLKVFSSKYQELRGKVHFLIPNDPKQEEHHLLIYFQQQIVQIKDERIEDGKLKSFIDRNHHKSYEVCMKNFQQIYNSQQSIVLKNIEERYLQEAIGPAKNEVLKQKLAEIPGSPLNLKFTDISSDSVTLEWDEPHMNAKVITSYDVEKSCDGQEWVRAEREVHRTLLLVSKLSPNSKYWFRVCGYKKRIKGESSHSIPVTTKAGKPSKPSTPSIRICSCTQAMIEIQRLTKVEENGCDVSDVVIEMGCNEATDELWTRTSYDNVDVCSNSEKYELKLSLNDSGQSYSRNAVLLYRVRMVNSVGESEPSDVVKLCITELLPGPAENLKLDAKARKIIASWKPPSINPTSLDNYKIEIKPENQGWNMVHSAYKDVKNEFKGLEPASRYMIKITSCNSVFPNGKEGHTTITGEVKTKADIPTQPKKPKISVDENCCGHAFLWVTRLTKEEENGSQVHTIDVESLTLNMQREQVRVHKTKQIKIKDIQSRDKVQLKIPVSASYTEPETTAFQFKVFMVNEAGRSKPCDAVELPVTELIPGPPRNIQINTTQSKQINVSWECPDVNPSSASFYCIELKRDHDESWRMLHQSHTDLFYIFKDLTPATRYEIRITSCNSKHWHTRENLNVAIHTVKTLADCPNSPQVTKFNVEENSHNAVFLTIPRLSKEEENGEPVTGVLVDHVCVNKDGEHTESWQHSIYKVKPRDYGKLCTYCVEHNASASTGVTAIHYRATMVNSIGNSLPSEILELSMTEFIPGRIQNLNVTALTSKQVSVSWEAPQVNQASVTFYIVEIKQNDKTKASCKVDLRKCTFRDLKPATEYQINIFSCNDKYPENKRINSVSKSICTKADVPNKPAKPIVENDPKRCYHKVHVSVPRLPEEEQNGCSVNKIIIKQIGVTKSGNLIGAWKEQEFNVKNDDRCNFGLEVKLQVNLTVEVATLYVCVVMENSIGRSESSDIQSVDTFVLTPGPPRGLYTSDSGLTYNRITVTWDEPQQNPRCVHYYQLQVKCKQDIEWVDVLKYIAQASEPNRAVVPNLTPNSEYDFRLYAVNMDNVKCPEYATLQSVATRKCRPNKIDERKVTLVLKSSSHAYLTLPKPKIQESGSDAIAVCIERYNERKIRCSSECKTEYSLNQSESEFSVVDKNENEQMLTGEIIIGYDTQFICIRLRNEIGLSDQSDYIGVASDELTPGPPIMLPIKDDQVRAKSVIIKWDPPQIRAAAAKDYFVQTKEGNSDEWSTVRPESIRFYERACGDPYKVEIMHLKPVTKYTLKVFAMNAKKVYGEPSEPICAQTTGGRPDAPIITSIFPDDKDPSKGRLQLKKPDHMSENGSPVTDISIEYVNDKTSNWERVDRNAVIEKSEYHLKLTFTIPNVKKVSTNQVHIYRVKVKNDFGESCPSDTYYLQLSQLYAGKVESLAAANITSNSVKLTWKESSVNPGLVKRYVVRRRVSRNSHLQLPQGEVQSNVKGNYSIDINNLDTNHSYTFQVTAQALNGREGPHSNYDVITRELIPSVPTKLKADKVAQNEIKIRWKIPEHNPKAVEQYQVQVMKIIAPGEEDEVVLKQVYSDQTTMVIRKLDSWTSYKIRVIAMNKAGKHGWISDGYTLFAACAEVEITTTLSDPVRKVVNVITLGHGARIPDKIDSDED